MNAKNVLIDTSAWIDYFRRDSKINGKKIDELLSGGQVCLADIIIAELIQGAKSEKEISAIEEIEAALTVLKQSDETWKKAGLLSYNLKRKGTTVNLTDCYIAVIAATNQCELLTYDKHFKIIAEHFPDLTLATTS